MTTLVTLTGTPTSLRFVNCFTPHWLQFRSYFMFWDLGHKQMCGFTFAPLLGIRKKQTIMFLCWSWYRSVKWNDLHHVYVSPQWLQIHSLKEHQHASDKHNHTLPIAVECWHIVFTVSDFHQNIKKLESPCGNQSDDCTTLCQQCLWDRPRGAVGFIPSG